MIHIKKLSGSRDAGKSIMSRSVFDGSENWKINVVERHIKYTKKIKLNARRHNVKFRSIQII